MAARVQKDPAFAQALLDDAIMIQKPGLSPKYVKDIVLLLDQGEERLIESAQRGTTPLQYLLPRSGCTIKPSAGRRRNHAMRQASITSFFVILGPIDQPTT